VQRCLTDAGPLLESVARVLARDRLGQAAASTSEGASRP
jgi:hypothetical protein